MSVVENRTAINHALETQTPTIVERAIGELVISDNQSYEDFSRPIFEILPEWDRLIKPHVKEGYCLVVFESQRSLNADTIALTLADDSAHYAARETSGFKGYFKGPLTERNICRSFCIWEKVQDAIDGSNDPRHLAASSLVSANTYDYYTVKRYIADVDGNFQLVREGGMPRRLLAEPN